MSGEASGLVDSRGFVQIIQPDGTRRTLTTAASAEVLRAWNFFCDWADFAQVADVDCR